ncbi:bifunctional hydroxymethylpyrimidine kinase/phosphomethylpyrimidine kinase [Rhodospirillum rubrum]|uniref:bifunctional hydroxymethylpyrimidine kinase/phosphomethylpyrimidine kinase n=1 Tax=Rhodospirillum rubrum TaxID=1085 RepID=UPI001908723B|nr:bifunctional hydroxymethylpyrimidine kinase/phosphomethylpyrimidine kinase [Rhodospirillum rubrum]MBK1664862.1 bifunctional hydroxymethylpyrimidine kinase/phosphomethylpyrimidine kinase [Rhodospirillum rubrum]MBK1676295.1 bifunctional hydroxymethylpyrimidine kinase/phosphomethylpyrimidine kinase [Rhodospirillum rubrum]
MTQGRVLIIAGSDSSGGAGIQADLKAVMALGGYGATAIAALTAQNTRGVEGIHAVPPAFVRQQMALFLDDIGADALKIGMLATAEVIEAVADEIELRAAGIPLVVDPVMVAKGGHRLLEESATAALIARLLPIARVLTPNLPEAEVLVGFSIPDEAAMEKAGRALLERGPQAVLMKGGHLEGDDLVDLLVTAEGTLRFRARRLHTTSTHGTGCTLASAIACGLAQGRSVEQAIARARAYVRKAMETAPGLGHGHGPLNHGFTVSPFEVPLP